MSEERLGTTGLMGLAGRSVVIELDVVVRDDDWSDWDGITGETPIGVIGDVGPAED